MVYVESELTQCRLSGNLGGLSGNLGGLSENLGGLSGNLDGHTDYHFYIQNGTDPIHTILSFL